MFCYEDVMTLVPICQMSSTNLASPDASFEFIAATTIAIIVFRDTRPRTLAFRKYPPPLSSLSNVETGSSPKRLSMCSRWQGVTQDKEAVQSSILLRNLRDHMSHRKSSCDY